MSESEFAGKFDIDENLLDEEWLKQPDLTFEISEMFADAKFAVRELEADLAVLETELAEDMRVNPENYGLEKDKKPAENLIKAMVPGLPKYVKLVRKINRARHRVDVLDGAKEACNDRRRALQDLVELHGQQYFGEPRKEGARDVLEGVKRKRRKRREDE